MKKAVEREIQRQITRAAVRGELRREGALVDEVPDSVKRRVERISREYHATVTKPTAEGLVSVLAAAGFAAEVTAEGKVHVTFTPPPRPLDIAARVVASTPRTLDDVLTEQRARERRLRRQHRNLQRAATAATATTTEGGTP